MSDLKTMTIEPKLYSLKHWCKERDISISTFRKLMNEEKAPKISRVDGINKIYPKLIQMSGTERRLTNALCKQRPTIRLSETVQRE